MASTTTISLSNAARTFIEQHTYSDPRLDTAEECPIYLEIYRFPQEIRARIVGIPGCSHTFGYDCLKKFLSIDPATPKNCPMCRAHWLPGFTSPTRRTIVFIHESSGELPRRRQNSAHPLLSRPSEETSHVEQGSLHQARQIPFTTTTHSTTTAWNQINPLHANTTHQTQFRQAQQMQLSPQEALLHQREQDFTQRELNLASRERALSAQENRLRARETALMA